MMDCVNLDIPHNPQLSLTTQILTALKLIPVLHAHLKDQCVRNMQEINVQTEIIGFTWRILQLPAGGPGRPGWLSTEGEVQILMPQTPTNTKQHRFKTCSLLLQNIL